MKSPKNKPIDDTQAEEMYEASKENQSELDQISIEDFMSDRGYRWSRSENMWVDDGSLAAEWADLENDYRKENVKLQ